MIHCSLKKRSALLCLLLIVSAICTAPIERRRMYPQIIKIIEEHLEALDEAFKKFKEYRKDTNIYQAEEGETNNKRKYASEQSVESAREEIESIIRRSKDLVQHMLNDRSDDNLPLAEELEGLTANFKEQLEILTWDIEEAERLGDKTGISSQEYSSFVKRIEQIISGIVAGVSSLKG